MIVRDALLSVGGFGFFGALPPGVVVQKEVDRPEGWLVGPGGRWHIPDPETAMRVTGTDWNGFQALVRVVPSGALANVPVVSTMDAALGPPPVVAQMMVQMTPPAVAPSVPSTQQSREPALPTLPKAQVSLPASSAPAAQQQAAAAESSLWTSPVFWGGLMLAGGGAFWFLRKRKAAAV